MAINSQTLSKEQVLIVGCGDIGRRFSGFLPMGSYEVTGLRRRAQEDTSFVRYQSIDVTDRAHLANVLAKGFDVIVITMTPAERSDAGYERAYVQTCRHLVELLQQANHKPRLVIFVSSSAVYGQMDGSWIDELSPTEPDSFSGKRLLEAEQIILTSGLPATVVRFSGIYGPGRNRLIEQVRRGKASSSTHITNRIHADDCARVLAHLVELNRHGQPLDNIYLASDSAPTPMIDVVTWLAEQMGVEEFLSPEAVNERGNKRCANKRLLATGFELRYPSFKDGYGLLML